eukprot:902113-Heterocapsa_arctica.AAC.1
MTLNGSPGASPPRTPREPCLVTAVARTISLQCPQVNLQAREHDSEPHCLGVDAEHLAPSRFGLQQSTAR